MPSPGKAKAQDISMKYRLFAPRGVKSNTAQQGCRLQPPSPNHCWKTFIAEKVFLPLFLFLGSPGAPAKARGQSLLQRAHDPPTTKSRAAGGECKERGSSAPSALTVVNFIVGMAAKENYEGSSWQSWQSHYESPRTDIAKGAPGQKRRLQSCWRKLALSSGLRR